MLIFLKNLFFCEFVLPKTEDLVLRIIRTTVTASNTIPIGIVKITAKISPIISPAVKPLVLNFSLSSSISLLFKSL